MGYGARSVKVLEPFQFADGIRLAWVWWTVGDGERRAVKVEEVAPRPAPRCATCKDGGTVLHPFFPDDVGPCPDCAAHQINPGKS